MAEKKTREERAALAAEEWRRLQALVLESVQPFLGGPLKWSVEIHKAGGGDFVVKATVTRSG